REFYSNPQFNDWYNDRVHILAWVSEGVSPFESDLGKSLSLSQSLEKLPKYFSVEVEVLGILILTLWKTRVLKFRSLLSGLCLSTQSLDFGTISWSYFREEGMKGFSLTTFFNDDSVSCSPPRIFFF
ncbi:hypothetical protein Tco_1361277, partial [Tanacetum coccineum]